MPKTKITTTFKNINLGEISAEQENDINPEWILSGFYDFNGVVDEIISGHKFIITGNKGSGKSIIGEHIAAKNHTTVGESILFSTKKTMDNFPYKSFQKILPDGNDDHDNRLMISWKWALLTQVLLSFDQDRGKESEFDVQLDRAIENIKMLGILPSGNLSDVAKISSTKDFKIKIMEFEIESKNNSNLHINIFLSQILSHLEVICQKLQSKNRHIIIIDGLDGNLSANSKQLATITGLIQAALELNSFFRSNNVPAKITILCRLDIFEKMPGSNNNRLNGYSANLNWYEDQVATRMKQIVKLACFRANFSGYAGDLLDDNFEKTYGDSKDAAEFLLENTRYTPRDFLKLLNVISKVKTDSKITEAQINSAVRKYSVEYFWPEIVDELDWHVHDKAAVLTVKEALRHFGRREFEISSFSSFCGENEYNLPIEVIHKVFSTMYNCGAVVNKTPGGKIFSKLKDGHDFNARYSISIHRGALKALGLN